MYRHTTPNEKVYIGITKQKPERRWQNGCGYASNIVFSRAIKKYGWDNIKHEVLQDGLTKEEAKQVERDLIATHRSTDRRFGYNKTPGGDIPWCAGKKMPQWVRDKAKGRWTGSKNPNARAVICLETLKVYETEAEAFAETGASKITDCCRRVPKHRTSSGYHWAYYDDNVSLEEYQSLLERYIAEESAPRKMSEENKRRLSESCQKSVRCTETGKVYKSLKEAAKDTGANTSNLCNCLKGKRKTAAGFHWEYA